MNRKVLGKEGEERAVRYLKKMGCIILQRNYRCRFGEIDIIALDQGILCFVEVKTRSRLDYGLPCESVDWRKEERIRRCAYVYLKQHNMQKMDMRIDIVEVIYRDKQYYIRWLRNGRSG